MQTGRLLAALLAGLTFAAWGGSLHGSFHYDDFANVVRDPATADPALIMGRLFTGVRPLLRASYAFDHAVWGFDAVGFLLTNLLLHVATVVGVYVLASIRLRNDAGAFTAALVFALQPASAEVVAWISGRSTGLATALVVAGLVVHATPALHGQRRWRAAIAAGLFALACMAKETAIIFPILVLLWDWTRGEAEEPGVLRAGPAFAVALASAAVMALSSRYRDLLDHSLGQRGLLESLTVNVRALPRLLSLWLRPSELSIVQPFDPGAGDPAGVTLGIACAAVLVAGVALRRRAPMVALATGWVLVALLPTCSVIVRTEVVSAKALYPAWIGPALVLGAGVSALSTRIRMRRAPAAAMATVIAGVMWVASVAVVDEVRVWSDDVALWERAVRRAPGDAIAWNNLGAGLLAARRPAAAIDAFRVALTLEPRNARTRMNLSLAAVLCGPTCERRP